MAAGAASLVNKSSTRALDKCGRHEWQVFRIDCVDLLQKIPSTALVSRAGARAVLQVVNALEDLLLHARHVVLERRRRGPSAIDGNLDVVVELLDGFNVGVVLLQALSERLLVVVGAVHLRAVQFRFQFAAAEGGAAPDG